MGKKNKQIIVLYKLNINRNPKTKWINKVCDGDNKDLSIG